VTLTVPPVRRWQRARPANVTFHTADLPEEHRTLLYNLPVTTAARTVADLARTLPFTDAVVAADSALRGQKTTQKEMDQVLRGCERWPGVRQARRVVEFADERAESPLESAARVVFHQFGLDPPELQVTIRTPRAAFRVDFCWPARLLVAEADGLVKYGVRGDLIRQLERDRLLRDAGYKVAHFTWEELFGTPEVVIDRIRRAGAAVTPY
jgi:very-short-patch-repair endonuclease